MKILHDPFRWMLLLSMLFSCDYASSQPLPTGHEVKAHVLRCKIYTYVDQQGTGLEAFSFVMPSDWKFEGGMQWILDNPAMPSVTAFKVFNPKGKEQFEVFPNRCFFWSNNPQLLNMFPPGSRYFGSLVMRPVSAQKALRDIILSEHRNGVSALKVIKDENVPELPNALRAGKQTQGNGRSGATGAKLRVSYIQDGVTMEEEFYAQVESYSFPVQSMVGTFYNTIWYMDYIFSFKAEQGTLESQTRIFQALTASFKLNPHWYAKYSHVIEYMAQQKINQIKSMGEFGRMLSRMNDQRSEEKMPQPKARGDGYDEVSQIFSDNTLGIDRYYDPHKGKEVELPSGYNYAWSNNNGEYMMSDNPNFNPNVGSNLHWEPLKRK
jgi:hypothetical protein